MDDGAFSSNNATGFINVSLVDDNAPMLNCDGAVFEFVEGSMSPVYLASSLTLSDRDVDHVFTSASVAIANPQDGDEIAVNVSLSSFITVQSVAGGRIELVSDAMAMEYQVSMYIEKYLKQ